MQVPASMLLVATLVIAAGVAVITPAQAADTQLSDVAYLQAAHCAGLAQGAKRDTHHIDALLSAEETSRMNWIVDRAEEMRSNGVREAHRATGALGGMKLNSDLNTCAAYLGAPQVTAVAAAQ